MKPAFWRGYPIFDPSFPLFVTDFPHSTQSDLGFQRKCSDSLRCRKWFALSPFSFSFFLRNFVLSETKIRVGHNECVEALFHKLWKNLTNNNKDTPLHIAARNGNLKTLRFLCNQGANVSSSACFPHTLFWLLIITLFLQPNFQNKKTFTPLFEAIFQKQIACFEALLDYNIDLNLECNSLFFIWSSNKKV